MSEFSFNVRFLEFPLPSPAILSSESRKSVHFVNRGKIIIVEP